MRCARCQHENPAGVKFCGECGTPLQRLAGSIQPPPSYADVQRSLTEALEQQTVTSEILRVISRSPTDVQPVFDTIIKNAVRLCDVQEGSVFRFDGQLIHLVASETSDTELLDALHRIFPRAPSRDSPTARAILSRAVTHVPDILADPDYQPTSRVQGTRRSILSVPMLRDGEPIGAITLGRRDVRPYSDKQITLLKTFADQAVIAIENARLFTELQARTGALTQAHAQVTEALDQQTATADILRVISSSPTDVQPVSPKYARRLPPRSGGPAPHLRHTVGASHPERAPVPGDRAEEPRAGDCEPSQERVFGEHVPRATDAAERDHRILRGPDRAHVRGAE
jgi:GAF domain-containing protein